MKIMVELDLADGANELALGRLLDRLVADNPEELTGYMWPSKDYVSTDHLNAQNEVEGGDAVVVYFK